MCVYDCFALFKHNCDDLKFVHMVAVGVHSKRAVYKTACSSLGKFVQFGVVFGYFPYQDIPVLGSKGALWEAVTNIARITAFTNVLIVRLRPPSVRTYLMGLHYFVTTFGWSNSLAVIGYNGLSQAEVNDCLHQTIHLLNSQCSNLHCMINVQGAITQAELIRVNNNKQMDLAAYQLYCDFIHG